MVLIVANADLALSYLQFNNYIITNNQKIHIFNRV